MAAVTRVEQPEFEEINTMIVVAIPEEHCNVGGDWTADKLRDRECPLSYAALRRDCNEDVQVAFGELLRTPLYALRSATLLLLDAMLVQTRLRTCPFGDTSLFFT